MRRNPTTTLPVLDPRDPGLLTRAEFMAMRDPQEKAHPGTAYDDGLADLNRPPERSIGSATGDRGRRFYVYQATDGSDAFVYRDAETDQVVAVLRDGVLYRDRFVRNIPRWVRSVREELELPVQREEEVKYPGEHAPSVVARNRKEYPVVLQRLTFGDERFELRAEQEPRPNQLDTLVLLNGDGFVVARGDNEWGATLLRVAREYRGRGIGRFMAQRWYSYNPASTSGGFTDAGRRNAISAWEDRVHEYLANGWYSDLVRAGRLTNSGVKKIVAGLKGKGSSVPLPSDERVTGDHPQLLTYVDDAGIAFVLYDARFLSDQDEKYVHGYGFLRDSTAHGFYFYRIEHDPKYSELVSTIGLQMVRDLGEKVYVAEPPGDIVEWKSVPSATYDDGYVQITKDVLPLKRMAQTERRVRGATDRWGQIRDTLLGMAESKWS